jgi:hypothetical protein
MHTRAKKKHVAGDRARRENVPAHILSYVIGKIRKLQDTIHLLARKRRK